MDKFWLHEIPLPAPREQQRISELLEQADGLRRQRVEADKLADGILPALFYEMFGDPATNPRGWPTENLLKICSAKQWPTISGDEILQSGFPVYGANGKIGFYDSYNHEFPTVLITCRGATCGTINVCEPKCYVTGNAMSLDDPDEDRISVEFLECYLRVRGLRDTITGAAQPQITRTNLGIVSVFTPLKPLVDKFSVLRRNIGTLAADMQKASDEIQKLFTTMLHRAFTGELTAKWREAHLKELLVEMEHQAKLLRTAAATN
jgi:restriction endonuclease S subunit